MSTDKYPVVECPRQKSEIIRKYLRNIKVNRIYYIDNKVYNCIYEIAEKEGRKDLAPQSDETLSEWRERAGIPHEYLELEVYLNHLFSDKRRDLLKQPQQKVCEEDKAQFAELPITDVPAVQSKTDGQGPLGQSKTEPERWGNVYLVVFLLFIFVIGPVVFAFCLETGMGGAGFIIFLVPLGIFIWCHTQGIWRSPTEEEKEAMREEQMRKWRPLSRTSSDWKGVFIRGLAIEALRMAGGQRGCKLICVNTLHQTKYHLKR